jgi:propionate CoA-transferase
MTLSLSTRAQLLLHIARWRATWSRHDLDHRSPQAGPKFETAREAARRIPDGAVVLTSGMAGNARCSIFYWAVKDRFLSEQHPRDLTWISVGAQGSRGKVPGTVEELSAPGIIRRYIVGHAETKKAQLRLADAGELELHTLPQGQMTFLFEALSQGDDSVLARTGVGTFLDPRVGPGSLVKARPGVTPMTLVEAAGDHLRYRMPRIDVAMFSAPAADREGNIYMRGATTYTESLESALAAKANGGTVIVAVADVVPKDPTAIFLPADKVDAVVVNPWNEQTGGVPQRRMWKLFTPESDVSVEEGVARLKFLNDVLKITPRRGPVDDALARLAASVFVQQSRPGSLVNIGVGLPEEVCRLVHEGGLLHDVTFFTETGCVGGIPAPGIFFGAAVRPERQITSAQVFHLAYEKLDTTILGTLQVDGEGNVNVSRRGPRALDYVGPGGLPDLTTAARNILFVGSWMAHAKMALVEGRLQIAKPGPCKYVKAVDEITFSGREALKAGKTVTYVTNVGVFRLTPEGLLLVQVMPGVDPQRDIVAVAGARILLPDGPVPVVPAEIVTGRGFSLRWPGV